MIRQLAISTTESIRVCNFIIFAFVMVVSLQAKAVRIEFPEEELARESVYPVFDNPEAVKRRAVDTEGRFEIGGIGGWGLNDAIFDPLIFGGTLTYHFSEIHAAQFMGVIFSSKTSQYVPQLEDPSIGIYNLSNSPRAKNLMLANYQITPYYGKISITKQTVLNLSTYGTLGAGTININDENTFAWSVGLGQKLYFSRHWGIRFDLRAVTYQAPNPFSYNGTIPSGSTPTNAEYQKQSFTNSFLTAGVVYLL